MDNLYLTFTETATIFAAGLAITLTVAYLLRLRLRAALLLCVNSVIGTAVYILLAAFTEFTVKFSALNIFLCAMGGLPCALLLIIIKFFIP